MTSSDSTIANPRGLKAGISRGKAAGKAAGQKARQKASGLIGRCIIFVVVMALLTGAAAFLMDQISTKLAEIRHEERLAQAVDFCDSLFDEQAAIREDVTNSALTDCKERLAAIADDNRALVLQIQVDDGIGYLTWLDHANQYITDDIVVSSIKEEDLTALSEENRNLNEIYWPKTTEILDHLRSEFDNMTAARTAVNDLFSSADDVRTGVNRKEYNDAKARVDGLTQADLKQELSDKLDKVLPVIEEQERIARELAEKARREREEEQRKIASSWHKLDISPYYINQFTAGIRNGCEAASLLMALKYKGYIRGADFRTFAANIPTSDDPNTGFYLSMTDLEPRNEAHWIAPAPLAAYGARTSGAAVINASGWSLDQLDNEVANGNPVVIYLTYGFRAPKDYSKGVPRNLHVLVLSGFNSYTGEQQFYDPWPSSSSNPSLSKAQTVGLYAASGYRAVVVR